MSTYANETAAPVTVEWCSRPSHWPTGTHDASGGNPCTLESATVDPGAHLVMDDGEDNAEAIRAQLEANSLVFRS